MVCRSDLLVGLQVQVGHHIHPCEFWELVPIVSIPPFLTFYQLHTLHVWCTDCTDYCYNVIWWYNAGHFILYMV